MNTALKAGWASADLTPERPVILAGQFHARVSEGVMDPIAATVLALERDPAGGPGSQAVMVSCDLAVIPESLRDAVRAECRKRLPDLDPLCVFLNATHTHSAPEIRTQDDVLRASCGAPTMFGLGAEELGVMPPGEYAAFAVERIAGAVERAWRARAPCGVAFGLGQAVVGRNRRVAYLNGESRMYGKTNDPEFSHIEGYEDHSVNLLCVYGPDKKLTGVIVNVACPSQVSENIFQLSADYWHETRLELRQRFGEGLFVLPQCGAAGDQSPHVLLCKPAEERMWRLAGRTERQEIARRIADTVADILPHIAKEIDWTPRFEHLAANLELPMNSLTETDSLEAEAEAEKLRKKFDELRRDFEAHPEKKQAPRWYTDITAAHRRMIWFQGVADRFRLQARQSSIPFETHVLRVGDVAFAVNPFEYYLDFGTRIKARSPAVQTFVVQLAGAGTYVPTPRAVAGKSYGAVPASNPIGPEGGRMLAEETLKTLAQMW